MKKILLSAVLLSSIGLNAQQEPAVKTENAVGIGTEQPRATLDVKGNVIVQEMKSSLIPSNDQCPCFLVVDKNGELKRVPMSQGSGIASGGNAGGGSGSTVIGGGTAVVGSVSPADGGVSNAYVMSTSGAVNMDWSAYKSNFSTVELLVNLPAGVPYSAYMSPAIDLPTVDGGTRKVSITYPKGTTDGSGKITATLLYDGDHTYAPKLRFSESEAENYELPLYFNGVEQSAKLVLHSGLNAVKNTEHGKTFVYPVVKIGDSYLTAMNLGAKYAEEAASNPGVLKVWRSNDNWQKDYKAYGSLFQWGRAADGHELVNWESSTKGTPVNPNMEWKKDAELKTYANDPCPSGFHTPSEEEWVAVHKAITGSSSYISSDKLWKSSLFSVVAAGYRNSSSGSSFGSTGTDGRYWSSTPYGDSYAKYLYFYDSYSDPQNYDDRSSGFSVRCLKK